MCPLIRNFELRWEVLSPDKAKKIPHFLCYVLTYSYFCTRICDAVPKSGGCSTNKFNVNKVLIMYLDSAKKQEIFSQFGKGATDTGSAESQIALFTHRIKHLTEHMKQNRKDHSSERALTGLVGKRRSLLNYLKRNDINRYRAIVKALGLRK